MYGTLQLTNRGQRSPSRITGRRGGTYVHGHSQRGCSPLQAVLRSTRRTQGHTTPSASDALVRNYVTNARVYRHTNWLASKTGVDAGADLGLAVSALGRLP